MNQSVKLALIIGGSATAAVAAIAAAVAVWNNKELRALRTYKKTGKILGRAAAVLQAVSQTME